MEKIPAPILSEILTSVGSFNQTIQLSQVCKKWMHVLRNTRHSASFEGSTLPDLSQKLIARHYYARFLKEWKLESLSLKGVKEIDPKLLARVLVSQPLLKKLDLTNSGIDLCSLRHALIGLKTKSSNLSSLKLEELRITNVESQSFFNKASYHYFYHRYRCKNFVHPEFIFLELKRIYAGNSDVKVSDLEFLFTYCKKLEVLDLSCNASINTLDNKLYKLISALSNTQLKKIYISNSLKIFDGHGIQVIKVGISEILQSLKCEEDLHTLEEWLDLGVDVNTGYVWRENSENSFTEFIAKTNNEDLLVKAFRIMIKYGLDLNYHLISKSANICEDNASYSCNFKYEKSLLNIAIVCRYNKLAELLLKFKASIGPIEINNSIKVGCAAPLPSNTLAAVLGNISVLQILREYNLLNKYSKNGHCNPICGVVTARKYETMRFLIENSVYLPNCKGHPNILWSSPEFIEMAKSSGYFKRENISIELFYEATQYYIYYDNDDKAFEMLEYLLCTDVKNKEDYLNEGYCKKLSDGNIYREPLFILASKLKRYNVLKRLVEKGFDVNFGSKTQRTPLYYAARSGNTELVIYLCDHGAKVNKQNRKGRTAIYMAAKRGHIETAKVLLELGADLSIKSSKGDTPLMAAEKQYRYKLCEWLREVKQ